MQSRSFSLQYTGHCIPFQFDCAFISPYVLLKGRRKKGMSALFRNNKLKEAIKKSSFGCFFLSFSIQSSMHLPKTVCVYLLPIFRFAIFVSSTIALYPVGNFVIAKRNCGFFLSHLHRWCMPKIKVASQFHSASCLNYVISTVNFPIK